MSRLEIPGVVTGLMARVAARKTYLEAFVCPLERGEPISCRPGGQVGKAQPPEIPLPVEPERGMWATCPAAPARGCDPWRAYQAALVEEETDCWHQAATAMGIPRRFLGASLAGPIVTDAIVRARRYWAESAPRGQCWLVLGDHGIGKTWAAVALLRAAAAGPLGSSAGRFKFFPSLCTELMDPERRVKTLERCKRTPLLVLDEFSARGMPQGGFLDRLVYELLWWREANATSTVVTTNLDEEQLRLTLSPPVLERLRGPWGVIDEAAGDNLRHD